MPVPLKSKADQPAAKVPAALAAFSTLPDCAAVRLPVVCALNGGISAATAWRWVKSGRLPKPLKLGPKVTAWRVGDLRAAMA